MKKIKDLSNKQFYNLRVIKFINRIKTDTYWLCKCLCGKQTKTTANSLNTGNTKSCGCLKEKNRYRSHDMSKTRFYKCWQDMNYRCNYKRNTAYPYYGGRGIKCEWLNFLEFKKDMFATYKDSLTLERINVNGNYCKENCIWITKTEQTNNKRNSVKHKGKNITHVGRMLGGSHRLVAERLKSGWEIEKAWGTPKLTKRSKDSKGKFIKEIIYTETN